MYTWSFIFLLLFLLIKNSVCAFFQWCIMCAYEDTIRMYNLLWCYVQELKLYNRRLCFQQRSIKFSFVRTVLLFFNRESFSISGIYLNTKYQYLIYRVINKQWDFNEDLKILKYNNLKNKFRFFILIMVFK